MSYVFHTNFRNALFANPALMNAARIKIVLWRVAPSMDQVNPAWAAAADRAALTALTGWDEVAGISGYPLDGFLDVSVRIIGNNHYVMFSQLPFDHLAEAVGAGAISIELVNTAQAGKLIFTTNTPTSLFSNISPGDALTANPDATIPDASNRWLFAWATPGTGATTVDPIEGPLSIFKAAPTFEVSNTTHVWMYPQRANMVSNPSFEDAATGVGYWATSGTAARVSGGAPDGGAWSCRFNKTTGPAVVAETSDWPTLQGDIDHEDWTFQMMVKGDGQLKVALVYWDQDYRFTGTQWGEETWDTNPDTWVHVACVRRGYQAHRALLRVECNGTYMILDRVLAERGFLKELDYFDGDTKYGGLDSFSWYGGANRAGKSYSMWYGARRAVTGRLFATPVNADDPEFLVDTEVAAAGMVYQWVPAGTSVIPHIDVFYPEDQRTPVPPKGTLSPYATPSTDGVVNPWV